MKRALAVAGLQLVSSFHILATERHWRALTSDVIVIGKLQQTFSIPGLLRFENCSNCRPDFFWGWRMRGKISVDHVLLGTPAGKTIDVELGCPFILCRLWWPPQLPPEMSTETGIWFLRKIKGKWSSPDGGFQSARASIRERADYENYIRTYRR